MPEIDHRVGEGLECVVQLTEAIKAKQQPPVLVSPSKHWDCPEIWGIMTIGIGPVGYVAGWGSADGMDAAFGWDGD